MSIERDAAIFAAEHVLDRALAFEIRKRTEELNDMIAQAYTRELIVIFEIKPQKFQTPLKLIVNVLEEV